MKYNNKMFDNIKKNVKVADAILAISVVCIALAIFLFNILTGMSIDAKTVFIYQDGKLVESITIDRNYSMDKEYISIWGKNNIVIENGQVYINESSCPDHLCELMGKIDKQGQVITCLPNRLQIVIEGNDESVDSLNY